MTLPAASLLIQSLSAETGGLGPRRTLLVASTRGEGRELLRTLARARGHWVGIDVTTPRPLAMEIAGAALAAEGFALLDEFAEQALLDELLDDALGSAGGTSHLRGLAEGVGFRKAVREAVVALRLAGVSSRQVESTPFADPGRRRLLARLLKRFGERVGAARMADTAAMLERATDALRSGAPLPAPRILLVPGLGMRGLAGRFLGALEAPGRARLAADPVLAVEPPAGLLWDETPVSAGPLLARAESVEIFRAGGVTAELREVLRRALAAGLRWDEVEIVTPDPVAYGPALHSVASFLGVPVTFAVGLPVERTRPGRAVVAWLRWVQDGFPDAVLRGLLEAGDVAPSPSFRDVDGASLARRLRRLRIGWGSERYLTAVEGAVTRLQAQGPRPGFDEAPEDAARRHDRALRELDALRALLAPLLEAIPPLPRRLDPDPVAVAPSDLAHGLSTFLQSVPRGGSVDETALERLERILDRARATLTRPTTLAAAVAVLADHLDIRVPAPRAEGRAPWGSAGGHLHFADIEHGGLTGRRATFLVGLDAGRFPGVGSQDPILLDEERTALTRELPTSSDRLHERRFRMAALLARLGGRVTLSWSAWEPSEGRILSPSPLLLQLHRDQGRPDATFQDLERRVGTPVSRIPRGDLRLDDEDVWLAALSRGGRLLAGDEAVRAAYPVLATGLRARAARQGAPGPHHGLMAGRPGLDPRRTPGLVLSASRLETLGECPLRYFYQYVLEAAPPEDPVFDPERWLNALQRGSLLHEVYEQTAEAARSEGLGLADPRLLDRAVRVLQNAAEATRQEVPPPSEIVFQREMAALRVEVGSFVGMVAADDPDWMQAELRFGSFGSAYPAVELELPRGDRLKLRGAIDRLDRLPSGGLRVVDYKTGSPRPFRAGDTFHGGRRLQQWLYASVAEQLTGSEVERMEYHFPTRKGENDRVVFWRSSMAQGAELVERLLDVAAAGRFLPTESTDDCTWCAFARVCRVRSEYGKTRSPLAEWGAEHFEDDAYQLFRAVRQLEEHG